MDDDWDLYAVVRGCAAIRSATPVTLPTTPLPTTLPSNQFQNPSFHHFSAEGLHEIYQDFLVNNPPTNISITVVIPTPAAQPINMQRYPAAPPRPRRRKNQQAKLVRQMTQEELYADSWAWRKYGQKPIKGSPYPRNYYRCSTTKGCSATDARIFIVSYCGEHTHPRPTHRSSLACSTRPKLGLKNNNNVFLLHTTFVSSFGSPSTPPMEPDVQNDVAEMADDEDDGNDNENIIPIDDDGDMFWGFQDSDHSSGGGFLSSPP